MFFFFFFLVKRKTSDSNNINDMNGREGHEGHKRQPTTTQGGGGGGQPTTTPVIFLFQEGRTRRILTIANDKPWEGRHHGVHVFLVSKQLLENFGHLTIITHVIPNFHLVRSDKHFF